MLRTPVSTKDDSQPSSKPDATDPHVEIISRGEKIELIAISVGIVSLVMTVFFATWLLRTGWITSPVSRHYSDYYKSLASRDPSPHDEL